MNDDRLSRQIHFLVEIDKLKQILRKTSLMDGSRRENSAEHSWHLALMALLLAEYAGEPDLDLLRVVKMVLVHDIVEIDAGDSFCYDPAATADQEERETRAAERLFSLLPDDQAVELRGLWEEFEAKSTPESRFATALDRLEPLLQNYQNEGGTWRAHGVSHEQVRARMSPIKSAAPSLWPYVERVIEEAVERGFLQANVPTGT